MMDEIRTAITTELGRRQWRPAKLADLARARGVAGRNTVYRWLRGDNDLGVSVAESLAALLGLTVTVRHGRKKK